MISRNRGNFCFEMNASSSLILTETRFTSDFRSGTTMSASRRQPHCKSFRRSKGLKHIAITLKAVLGPMIPAATSAATIGTIDEDEEGGGCSTAMAILESRSSTSFCRVESSASIWSAANSAATASASAFFAAISVASASDFAAAAAVASVSAELNATWSKPGTDDSTFIGSSSVTDVSSPDAASESIAAPMVP